MKPNRPSWGKIIFALLLLVVLPVFIWAVMTQRIELRKKAALVGPTLTIQPSAVVGAAGDTENLAIALDTQGASVSAAEIHLTYDPSIIEVDSFTPQNAAPVVLPVVLSPASIGSGSATITLGSSPDSPFTGTAIIGDLTIKLLSSASAQISFTSDTVVTAIGQDTNALALTTGVGINNAAPTPKEFPGHGIPRSTRGPKTGNSTPSENICADQANGSVCDTACTNSMPPHCYSGTCQNNVCIHSATPSATLVSCTNASDGTACSLPGCAPCQSGKICPAICRIQTGVCQNGRCIGATPTPPPYIQVLTPNGGEQLTQGQYYTISWQASPGIANYDIDLVNSLGQESLINGVNAPTTSYSWRVDSPIAVGATFYKIKITNGATQGLSNNFFITNATAPTPTVTPTPTPTPPACNFSDAFSGTSLNTSNWTQHQMVTGVGYANNGGSVGIANGTATISQPYMAGKQVGTQTLLQQPISGDISADVTLTPNVGAHGEADTYLGFQPADASSGLDVGWTNDTGTPRVVMATYSPTQPWTFNYSLPAPTGITSFHVKLIRTGNSFTGYVDYGNGFVLLGSVPNVFTGNGNVILQTFNDSNGFGTNDVSTGFSNFSLSTCNVTLPTNYLTPEPIEFWVELAGVTGNAANGALVNIKFYLKDGTVSQLPPLPLTYTMETTSDGQVGVYTATTTISNPIPAGTQFRVQVIGEKHLAIKFCKAVGQTGQCGDTDYITMPTGTGTLYLNFTGRPLPPGDLNQDGAIDATDIGLFTNLFSKTPSQLTAPDYKLGDVNYDGQINQFDLNLILQSLSTRYGE